MITPEAWTPVIINSQCSSIKWIERSTEYVLPRVQVYIYIYLSETELLDDTILLFGACTLNMINLRVSSKIKLELIYLFIYFLFIIFGGKNGAQRKLF